MRHAQLPPLHSSAGVGSATLAVALPTTHEHYKVSGCNAAPTARGNVRLDQPRLQRVHRLSDSAAVHRDPTPHAHARTSSAGVGSSTLPVALPTTHEHRDIGLGKLAASWLCFWRTVAVVRVRSVTRPLLRAHHGATIHTTRHARLCTPGWIALYHLCRATSGGRAPSATGWPLSTTPHARLECARQ
jgi:hypothetical protein